MVRGRSTLLAIEGVPLRADTSWLPLAPLLLWTLAEATMPALVPELSRPGYWGMALAGTLAAILSLAAREAVFVAVARRSGIALRSVRLLVVGGAAEGGLGRAAAELKAAAGGLLASLLLGLSSFAGFLVAARAGLPLTVLGVALFLMGFNGLIAALNVLPLYPLSGGRVLAAGLVAWTGDAERAAAAARGVGVGAAVAIVLAGGWLALTGHPVTGAWSAVAGLLVCRNALPGRTGPAA